MLDCETKSYVLLKVSFHDFDKIGMITVSAKSEYGLSFLAYLALRQARGKPISLAEVAESEKISRGYLEEVAGTLKRSGFLKGKKGKGGGYVLARSPKDIKISEIIASLEGPISPVKCLALSTGGKGGVKCFKEKTCGTKKVWMSLKNKIEEHLSEISLEDII